MQKIKCIIIEDEPLAIDITRDYIEQVPYLELTGVYKTAMAAGSHLQQEGTDLIFLDIHLPGLKGLAFLRTLSNPPAVIVTTAYHQYAVEGFELSVADYLMKPFPFERFLTAVNKAAKLTRTGQPPANEESAKEKSLLLTINRKKVKILLNDILFIESQREYVKVCTLNGVHISKISTTELESLLPGQEFARVHRSFIVSINKIDSYSKGELDIKGHVIPIGKGYKNEQLFSRIGR